MSEKALEMPPTYFGYAVCLQSWISVQQQFLRSQHSVVMGVQGGLHSAVEGVSQLVQVLVTGDIRAVQCKIVCCLSYGCFTSQINVVHCSALDVLTSEDR